jgi:putative flippase GtrA
MNTYRKWWAFYRQHFSLIIQLYRYALVGLTSAAIHFGSVVFLVQIFGFAPLSASIFAYPFSFQMSYWGHRLWTFDNTTASHLSAFPKLIMVQLVNFSVGQSLFFVFLKMNIPYPIALLIVLAILPIFTFISSRWWVFRSR